VPDPEMIQSVKEDQEAPREKAAIMSKDWRSQFQFSLVRASMKTVFSSVGVLGQFQIRSELVTRQEARKQDSEVGWGALNKTRNQPVKH
jgi:hypothetical protein